MAAFATINSFMKEWKWSKGKVKPKFQMSFLVICHHLCLGNQVANEGKQKNLICWLCYRTNTKRSGTTGLFGFLFVCLLFFTKMLKYNESIVQSEQHGTYIYFVILCRQNGNPLGQQFSCTH